MEFIKMSIKLKNDRFISLQAISRQIRPTPFFPQGAIFTTVGFCPPTGSKRNWRSSSSSLLIEDNVDIFTLGLKLISMKLDRYIIEAYTRPVTEFFSGMTSYVTNNDVTKMKIVLSRLIRNGFYPNLIWLF